jgi:DNA repair protein RAD5
MLRLECRRGLTLFNIQNCQVHRMGQTREVAVKRFVVRGTVEERILTLQTRKQTLAHTVLAAADASQFRQQRLDDLRLLFGFK